MLKHQSHYLYILIIVSFPFRNSICFLLITLQNEATVSCAPDEKDNIKDNVLHAKSIVLKAAFKTVENRSDIPEAVAYVQSIFADIDEIMHKCIVLMFRMETVDKLEAFWNLYQTGGLLTSLSHDILTPQRVQQMITDAKNDGIELEESDFCLQITIQESDYLFVKDVLTSKNGMFEIEWNIYDIYIVYMYITKILFHSIAHLVQVDIGFEFGSGHMKVIKLVFCCFSPKYEALMIKLNEWLARNQNNVYK